MEQTLEEKLTELLDLYEAALADQYSWMLLLFALPLVCGVVWWGLRRVRKGAKSNDPYGMRSWARTEVPIAVLMASTMAGLLTTLNKASMFDDAFISFRYARNFARGYGLVWNEGERIEGYTNFLWTLLIGVLDWATPIGPLHWAIFLTPTVFVLNLIVIYLISKRINGQDESGPKSFLPIAVVVVAVHSVFTVYGTTGMETGFACLLVLLGAFFLVSREDPLGAALSGLMLILAALARPDHGLFYVVGGFVVLISRIRPAWRARAGGTTTYWAECGRHLSAYAAPFAIYGVYALWKLTYYGQLLPNTYYAKSAYLTWWDQGAVYASMFFAGTHGWVFLACFLTSLLIRSRSTRARRLKLFVLGSLLTYGVYVVRVGGDYMYGRFFVVLVPLLVLGVDIWVHELLSHARRRRRFPIEALVVAGFMLATLPHISFIEPRKGKWGVVEEHLAYPIRKWDPITIGHPNFRSSHFWKKKVVDRGFDSIILATGSIGMVGYYTNLPLVDVRGLTDAVVAHTEAKERGKPGHEKLPPEGYLLERGVHFCRMSSFQGTYHPRRNRELALIKLWRLRDRWQIIYYDRELMRELKQEVPELRFTDFEEYLDRYISNLHNEEPDMVQSDLAWFREYYFDHNEDTERLQEIENWLDRIEETD